MIYLAGGLFNAAERAHNTNLEQELKKWGYTVILPQREALKHFDGDHFDIPGIVEDCAAAVSNPDTVTVGCIDGPDADSGTVVECTLAVAKTGRAIVYRTDFRTDTKKEIGVNAMLTMKGITLLYHPCFATEKKELKEYYIVLAQKIHEIIQKMQ